jgi:hypothetical protein
MRGVIANVTKWNVAIYQLQTKCRNLNRQPYNVGLLRRASLQQDCHASLATEAKQPQRQANGYKKII